MIFGCILFIIDSAYFSYTSDGQMVTAQYFLFFFFQGKVREILFFNLKALSKNIANTVFKDLSFVNPILKKKILLISVTTELHKKKEIVSQIFLFIKMSRFCLFYIFSCQFIWCFACDMVAFVLLVTISFSQL